MSEFFLIAGLLRELASLPGLVVLVPLAAAAGLAFVTDARLAGWIDAVAATLAFLLAAALPWHRGTGFLLAVDPLSAHLAILTGFVAMTAVWSGRDAAAGRLRARFQAGLGAVMLALLANNLVVTWAALEAAGAPRPHWGRRGRGRSPPRPSPWPPACSARWCCSSPPSRCWGPRSRR